MDVIPELCACLFESVPVALCVVDGDGRILLMNCALERLLGWRLSEQRGQPLARCLQQAIVDPAQALCWTVALSEALALGKMTYLNLPTDFRTGPDDAQRKSLTGVVMPYQHGDTEHPGGVMSFHSRALTDNMDAIRARFLAAISHELGSPVSSIAAAADLLAEHLDPGNVQQRKLIQIIQGEVTRLQRLMEQSLSASPVPETTRSSAKNVVTLRPLLHRVAEIAGLWETDHRIVVHVPADLPFVWGDADGIQEVLSNLIDNAVRYSPPGTAITLTAEERPDEVLISVIDQGFGLPAKDRQRLFEPFYRGERDRERTKGQGLGLPIAMSVAQSVGGELWYEEEAAGGLRFCFSLPRADDLRDEEEGGEKGHGGLDPRR